MRIVGGRTNVWARQSYRLSEQAPCCGTCGPWAISAADEAATNAITILLLIDNSPGAWNIH